VHCLQFNAKAWIKRRYYTLKEGMNSRVSSQPLGGDAKCLTPMERCVTFPGKMNENSFITEIGNILSQ
jgi:hypothetical protein